MSDDDLTQEEKEKNLTELKDKYSSWGFSEEEAMKRARIMVYGVPEPEGDTSNWGEKEWYTFFREKHNSSHHRAKVFAMAAVGKISFTDRAPGGCLVDYYLGG